MFNIVGFAGTNSCTENAAIAEGLADVFAELAEAKKKGTAPDWMHGERNMYTPGEGYHISTDEAPTISTVNECYQYSTIVSHMAAFMSNYTSSTSVQNEFWFKAMCLMTKNTDFAEFQKIMNIVTAEMYENGRFTDSQYSSIITGIEMTGLSEEDLYSEETYQ
jgi:Zn-dependent metalloprotease